MQLTSAAFAWLLCLAAVAAFLWSILAWPKSAGPGWAALCRRVGHQLLVVVLVVAALGTLLNREYDWYSNWSDLASSFGSAQPADELQAAGAPATEAAAGHLGKVGSDASAGDAPSPGSTVSGSTVLDTGRSLGLSTHPGPNGQYRTFTVPGPISGHTGPVTVWFPADYDQPAQAFHRFPVIEAFHGIPGSPVQLTNAFVNLGSSVMHEVGRRALREAIVVMPDYAPRQVDTECVNGTGSQPRMEDWITKDVPAWLAAHVRVDRDRGSWAALGFSAGGWCAAMAAMLHPETYAAAIVLQGYFRPIFEAPYVPFAADGPAAEHYDLVRLAHDDPPRTALWILTSKADPLSYGTTRQLLADARPPLSVTADVLTNGGHRTSVWAPVVPRSLDWLGTIPGFRP